MGNPNLSKLNQQRSHRARKVADHYSHLILPLRDRGNTYQEIANILTEMNITTPTGGKFYPMQVKRIFDRANQTRVLGAGNLHENRSYLVRCRHSIQGGCSCTGLRRCQENCTSKKPNCNSCVCYCRLLRN